MEEYLAKAKSVYTEGLELIHDIQGWTRIETDSELVNCFRRPSPENNFDIFKGEIYYEKPPNVVSRYIFDNFTAINNELMSEMFDYWRDVQKYGENCVVITNLLKG